MKPVLYLDVDDVLIMFPPYRDEEWWENNKGGAPANGVQEFLEFARRHMEVRWLTSWATSGWMPYDRLEKLSGILKVPTVLIEGFENPMRWFNNKTTGINWEEHKAGREWFWIEDGILEEEIQMLKDKGCYDRYIHVNTSYDPDDLLKALDILKERVLDAQTI